MVANWQIQHGLQTRTSLAQQTRPLALFEMWTLFGRTFQIMHGHLEMKSHSTLQIRTRLI